MAAVPSGSASEAVLQAFHILNQFDIHVGTICTEHNGIIYTDSTLLTCVKDPQSLKYYFKTYEDQSIRMIDLKKFDMNATTIKKVNISGNENIMDISQDLK